MARERAKMWAVKRDRSVYVIYPIHGVARKACKELSSDTKHKWSVEPIFVLVREDARPAHGQ